MEPPIECLAYGTKFKQDNGWYRSIVIKTNYEGPESRKCLVEFLDFGNREVVDYCDLFKLPDTITAQPPLCRKYAFDNLTPVADPTLRQDAIAFIESSLDNKSIIMDKIFVNWNDLPLRYCICTVDGVNINDELVKRGYMTCSSQDAQPQSSKLYMKAPPKAQAASDKFENMSITNSSSNNADQKPKKTFFDHAKSSNSSNEWYSFLKGFFYIKNEYF